MAPRASQKQLPLSSDPNDIFHGMVVFLVPKGVQRRRLQVWKQKLEQMGATIEDDLSKRVTHIFASNSNILLQEVNRKYLKFFNGWLESCLKSGERVSEAPFLLNLRSEEANTSDEPFSRIHPEVAEARYSDDDSFHCKRTKISSENSETIDAEGRTDDERIGQLAPLSEPEDQGRPHAGDSELRDIPIKNSSDSTEPANGPKDAAGSSQLSSLYNPPDFNKNITEIFGKLINIYRALGDDRRSFSYHKAILVIEKLHFKIESVDQVKHLPAIGKSMQDHIHEIVTTGKLSKLEHFETDEKVRAVTLFGEIWGVGPATALKLYEKGHRTLGDLKNDDSLTSSQKIGLKFFEDIKKRIPRHEVKDMEMLLQKSGEDLLPGVAIVCGGSYRRGKASCGDMDIIITHPDGERELIRVLIRILVFVHILVERSGIALILRYTQGVYMPLD